MYGERNHECESEDDCEIYYLRPVNEYNIRDKIKEANKELFATEAMVDETDPGRVVATIATNKKVHFALNLENYDEPGADGAIAGDDVSEAMNANEEDLMKFSAINEEEEEIAEILTATLQDNTTEEGSLVKTTTTTNNSRRTALPDFIQHASKNEINLDEEEIIEELCEEMHIILDMDMEMTRSGSSVPRPLQQQRNKMFKQATFNLDDGDGDNDELMGNEDETKLSTDKYNNTIKNEQICADLHIDNNNCGAFRGDVVTRTDDNDECDQLSVIAASYIPDDFDYVRDKDKFKKSKKASPPPFNRRRNLFSIVPPPEVTTLKFNYRPCCEYRHAVTQSEKQLPKYTGYLSEYGLTREQLAKRAAKVQRKQRFVVENALLAKEQEMLKMQDNERAFTTWLKRKMRFPINKTRNMFDVLKSKNGSGSTSNGSGKNDKTALRNR